MLELISLEFRKIYSKRNLILISIAILGMALYILISIFSENSMYHANGEQYYGFTAVKERMKINDRLKGSLDTYTLQDSFSTMKRVMNNRDNFDSNNLLKPKVFANEFIAYSNISDLLVRIYSPINTFDVNHVLNKNIDDIKAKDFREKRNLIFESLLKSNYYSEKSILKIEHEYHQIGSLVEYGNTKGWSSILKNATYINIFILILIIVLTAPVFARDRQLKFDSLLYTTKLGKTKDMVAKLFASYLAISLLYFSINFLLSIMEFAIFSTAGHNLIIQIDPEYWLSIFPITFMEAFFLSATLGYIASVLMFSIVLFISSVSKKDYIVFIIAIGILFIPKIITSFRGLNHVLNLFPIKVADVSVLLKSFENLTYEFIGYVFLSPAFMIISSVFASTIFILLIFFYFKIISTRI